MGHAVVLFLSLEDMARRDSRRDSGAGACSIFKRWQQRYLLGPWWVGRQLVGLRAWWPSILSPFLAVASQGEMAAWKWIDGRSDRLTCFWFRGGDQWEATELVLGLRSIRVLGGNSHIFQKKQNPEEKNVFLLQRVHLPCPALRSKATLASQAFDPVRIRPSRPEVIPPHPPLQPSPSSSTEQVPDEPFPHNMAPLLWEDSATGGPCQELPQGQPH